MKTVKRLLNFIFLICLCCTTLIANAAGEELGMIVDGSRLTDQSEVSVDTRSGARGTYLSYGTAKMIFLTLVKKILLNKLCGLRVVYPRGTKS